MQKIYVTDADKLLGSDGEVYYAKRTDYRRVGDFLLIHGKTNEVVMQANTLPALRSFLKKVKVQVTDSEVIYNLDGFIMKHDRDTRHELVFDS
jgi:uncharacterized protein (UPF0128 family)